MRWYGRTRSLVASFDFCALFAHSVKMNHMHKSLKLRGLILVGGAGIEPATSCL